MRVSLELNILIVMQFSGGGGYMEQDKAHTPPPPPPPPVNHGQVYKLVLEIYIENLFKNLYLWKF